jgi:hypothetical protein
MDCKAVTTVRITGRHKKYIFWQILNKEEKNIRMVEILPV